MTIADKAQLDKQKRKLIVISNQLAKKHYNVPTTMKDVDMLNDIIKELDQLIDK